MINSGGEKIFPEEVEEEVERVDGVVDRLVVGINDRFGQAVTAVVSVAEGMTVDSATIIASVKQDLAGFKAPRSVCRRRCPAPRTARPTTAVVGEYAESPTPRSSPIGEAREDLGPEVRHGCRVTECAR